LEEATTNLVTNPSFEHSTYDTNWSIGTGATASQNTTAPYYKFGAKSLKLVASADTDVTTSINPGSTNIHTLSAYVYNGTSGAIGGTVDSGVAQLVYGGVGVGATYSDMGGGWWRLNYSAAAGSGAQNYGVQVKSGKTIYVDGVQLEQKSFFTTYADGSIGVGYSWSGVAQESNSARTAGNITYPAASNISGSEGTLSIWQRITDSWSYKGTWDDYLIMLSSNKLHIKYNPNCVGCGGQFSANYNQWWGSSSGEGGAISASYSNGGRSYFSNNGWTHTVLTWKNNEFRWYRNSSLVGEDTSLTNNADFSSALIYLPDFIISSDFRIFDSALSLAEVAALYYAGLGSHQIQAGFTERYTDGEPPTALWHLNEGAGSNIYDSIDSHHGALGAGDSAPSWTGGSSCVSQNCLSFDGANDYASITDTINGLKSLSFWVKPTAATTSILDLNGSQTVTLTNNVLAANNFSSPSIYVNGQATTSLSADSWSHVLITSNTSFAASSLKLGQAGGNFFSGYIDEIKVFPYVLSADQIKKELNLGKAVSFGEKPETAPSTPLSEKLVAYWKFDEGYGTTVHNSGNGGAALNGSLGTGSSAPTWTNNGKLGKALSFGSSKYVIINDSPALDITAAVTLSAWINPTSLPGYTTILAKRDVSINEGNYALRTGTGANSDEIEFYYYNGGWQIYTTNNANLLTGNWYHIVATYNGTSVKIYKNGVLLTGSCTTGTCNKTMIADNNNVAVGRAGDSAIEYFNGLIDEVKIYNYALTEEEVKLDYNQGMAAVMGAKGTEGDGKTPSFSSSAEYCIPGDTSYCAPPVGEWNFEEGSGGTVNDTSGNGNTGAWYGSGDHWGTGKIGKAGKFNGTDDEIQMSSGPILSTNATIEGWFYWKSGNTSLLRDNTSADGWILAYNNGGNITYRLGGSSFNTSISVAPLQNKWVHYTMTKNGGDVKYFINGALEHSSSGASSTANILPWHIMKNGTSTGWISGYADNIKIYNYARTPAQIAWDYNRGAPVGHWRFDECEGSIAHDVSGNGNHGAINIGASAPQTAAGTCADGQSTSAWYNGRQGKYNASLNFDGADDYILINNPASNWKLGTGDFTATFWFKQDPTQSRGDLFSWKSNDSTDDVGFIANNGTLDVYLKIDGSGGWKLQGTGASYNKGVWNHGVITRKSSTIYTYINTIQDSTTAVSNENLDNNSGNIRIGSNHASGTPSFAFNGQIDDVRIYNYALTDEQIKMLYNDGAVRFGE